MPMASIWRRNAEAAMFGSKSERHRAGSLPCLTASTGRLDPRAHRPLATTDIIARNLGECCSISHSFSVAFHTLFKAATRGQRGASLSSSPRLLPTRRPPGGNGSSQTCTASYAIPSSLRALRVRQDHATRACCRAFRSTHSWRGRSSRAKPPLCACRSLPPTRSVSAPGLSTPVR